MPPLGRGKQMADKEKEKNHTDSVRYSCTSLPPAAQSTHWHTHRSVYTPSTTLYPHPWPGPSTPPFSFHSQPHTDTQTHPDRHTPHSYHPSRLSGQRPSALLALGRETEHNDRASWRSTAQIRHGWRAVQAVTGPRQGHALTTRQHRVVAVHSLGRGPVLMGWPAGLPCRDTHLATPRPPTRTTAPAFVFSCANVLP